MEQDHFEQSVKHLEQTLKMGRTTLYRWRTHIREYLPPEIAKIYNRDAGQETYTAFEIDLIPRVKRLRTLNKLGPREAVQQAFEEWIRDQAYLRDQFQAEKTELQERLQAQEQELKQLRSDVAILRKEQQTDTQATTAMLEKMIQMLAESMGQLEKIEESLTASDAKILEKVDKLDAMQRDMGGVFNAISRELVKRNVI
ncbi:hypothetical protein [Deinococcus cellulosilyticus]|uniref:Uncharacterized protein n=1 Tax=Deinococcus cellulosilyticus (strain DSM 18568 / NBRC 106333 / KACC 11606 / 5516J-15) TaxID=1223518 RepID=A0A511NBL7_DEIC1|nr:hypothetical protein [Deinococcus cellulosilyticus]GEM50192.1 hypothetical protein DC3_58270 [Deinococcus cellulosilyticus NBRC 106333 = KACC 11606]